MKHTPKIVSAATATLAVFALAGCNLKEPSPFDPRAMQRSGRLAAGDNAVVAKRPLPTTMQSPFNGPEGRRKPTPDEEAGQPLGTEPTLRLSLQEVIQRVVANNGEVKVAGYTPAIDQTRVIEAEARFDPTLFLGSSVEKRTSTEVFQSLGSGSTFYTAEGGLRQNLESGGQVELRYRTQLVDQLEPAGGPSLNVPDDPLYSNELQIQIQQPLLRDFGNEINRARISINRNNQKISVLEFRRQLEETIAETERFYWQLVQAEREMRIQERLLQKTIDTAYVLLIRKDEDVSGIQSSQANSSVESRRAELIRSRARVRDLSDEIKRRMQDPSIPTVSPIVILPASPALDVPVQFNIDDTLAQAYENRFELGQQVLRVDNANIASKVAKNNLLPQLNLQATGALQGVNGQWVDALGDQTTFENYSFQLALQFEIPIGNRAARAIYQRAMLQRAQAAEQYSSLLSQVQLEVRQTTREVDTTWQEIAANRKARFAAGDALAAVERRRDGAEPLTPTFVQLILDRQEALAQAERAEAQAISNYNVAISRLELAKGTLLRYNNILLTEEDTPFVKTFGKFGR